jgi:hypothetical protein
MLDEARKGGITFATEGHDVSVAAIMPAAGGGTP